MNEQQKILRVFRLIQILAGKQGKTVKQLQTILEVSQSTVYKYINLLAELGYLVEKDMNDTYFIFEPDRSMPLFIEEEIQFLQHCLSGLPNNNPYKISLSKKIQLNGLLIPTAQELKQRMYARLILQINEAITNGHWITLCKYQSAESSISEDRIVLPKKIDPENGQLTAFDVKRNAVRMFKIHRITKIEYAETPAQPINPEILTPVDLFGLTGPLPIKVELLLSQRAKHLLEEEYPAAGSSIMPEDNTLFPYRYTDEVRDFKGIGRFILGLPGETKIISPVEFIAYLLERMKGYTFIAQIKNVPVD
jgi:proteasome accessory factor C